MAQTTRSWILLVVIASTLGLASGRGHASTLSVEEIVAKHIEAHGGREAWGRIDSLKATGQFTAFSTTRPFTLHRTSDDRFHLDHWMDEQRIVIGHDGETTWWINEFFQKGATRISGADLAVAARDREFLPALFLADEKGWALELSEQTDFEGDEVVAVELTREDDSKETWYLNPETFVAIGRESPGSDFGRPMPQRTWFDDYREIDGIMLPFFIEVQWYTRDRIFEFESVELNVPIDDAIFAMPVPHGMEPFQVLVGTWTVQAKRRQQPAQPWSESEHTSTITGRMRGGLLEESYVVDGVEAVRTLSYDQQREQYVMTQMSEEGTGLDVQLGNLDEEGTLLTSNLETGTERNFFGMTFYGRYRFNEIGADSFTVEQETSMDGGQNWFVQQELTYTRAAE